MRYSKSKIILTTILVTSSFIFIIFLIFKGIDYSKKISSIDPESEEKKVVKTEKKTKVKTSVSETKTTKKETKSKTKTDTKTNTTKKNPVTSKKTETTTTKKTTTAKKTEEKKETKQVVNEEKVVKNEKKPVNKKLNGKYTVSQLKIGDKIYSKKEIQQLKKEGNSLSLEMKDGAAILQVLDTNGIFEYDNDYFNDGRNKYPYSKNTDRVRIEIDGKNILFVKE